MTPGGTDQLSAHRGAARVWTPDDGASVPVKSGNKGSPSAEKEGPC